MFLKIFKFGYGIDGRENERQCKWNQIDVCSFIILRLLESIVDLYLKVLSDSFNLINFRYSKFEMFYGERKTNFLFIYYIRLFNSIR